MDKETIINLLQKNYQSFVGYISGLTNEEYAFSYNDKWTASQQLEHIVLCVKPLVQVYSMDKAMIKQLFGETSRLGRGYEDLLSTYQEKLKEGGKAPNQFLPQNQGQKEILTAKLTKLIKELSAKIETFSDQELDTLLIPHPLLGNLTLREMLYNAIYHVEHHKEQVRESLK